MNSNINKFDNKSDFYDIYRPKYAEDIIDYIISSIDKKESLIVDIGCGTGIFTKQLADKKCNVIGIEPNEEMFEKAKKNLYGIKVLNETAENTKLKPNSIDIITVAQALHWFNMQEFTKEAKRILKSDGKIAIIYNNIDDNTEIIKKYKKIHEKYCSNYNNHNRNLKELFDEILEENYIFNIFQNNQRYTYEEFMGYSFSLSYSLKEDDINYNKYIEELKELFKEYSKNNVLEFPMYSKLAFGKLK